VLHREKAHQRIFHRSAEIKTICGDKHHIQQESEHQLKVDADQRKQGQLFIARCKHFVSRHSGKCFDDGHQQQEQRNPA
jgi:hypothetical protein